jgi:hypothetical protein
MRRTPALALLISLLALLGLLAGCGDDGGDESANTTAAPTTETTEEPEVFDPGDYGDDADGEPADDDPDDEPDDDSGATGGCSVDPEETNEASAIGDLIDCVLPDLASAVSGANFQSSGSTAEVFVSGDIDVQEALQVCEVVTAYIEAELTEWDDVVLTITTDTDVVAGETGLPLVTATDGDGSCELF